MSALEQAAKPLLLKLIQGQATVLTAELSSVLAQWIALKVMVAEHNDPGQIVTLLDARQTFRDSQLIPSNWRIWVACCGVGGFETGFYRHSATFARPNHIHPVNPNVQSITFGIGELLVHVWTSPAPDLWLYTLHSNNAIFQLYPMVGPIDWPPTAKLSFDDANEIAHMLDRVIERPSIHWKSGPS